MYIKKNALFLQMWKGIIYRAGDKQCYNLRISSFFNKTWRTDFKIFTRSYFHHFECLPVGDDRRHCRFKCYGLPSATSTTHQKENNREQECYSFNIQTASIQWTVWNYNRKLLQYECLWDGKFIFSTDFCYKVRHERNHSNRSFKRNLLS